MPKSRVCFSIYKKTPWMTRSFLTTTHLPLSAPASVVQYAFTLQDAWDHQHAHDSAVPRVRKSPARETSNCNWGDSCSTRISGVSSKVAPDSTTFWISLSSEGLGQCTPVWVFSRGRCSNGLSGTYSRRGSWLRSFYRRLRRHGLWEASKAATKNGTRGTRPQILTICSHRRNGLPTAAEQPTEETVALENDLLRACQSVSEQTARQFQR